VYTGLILGKKILEYSFFVFDQKLTADIDVYTVGGETASIKSCLLEQ
jgi:hypothetical protein